MSILDRIRSLTGSSVSYIKNPSYDPNNQGSNFYVDRSKLSIGTNPVDSRIEQAAGKTKISDMLKNTSNSALFGGGNVSPAWQQALSGYSVGNNGQLTAPARTTNNPTNPTTPAAPTTINSRGVNNTISAPVQTAPGGQGAPAPSYDPTTTGQPVDPNRLSPDELKDLATKAGQAGLSLTDYTALINQNAQLGSADSENIRTELGIDEAREKALARPDETSAQLYERLFKEVGLPDIKAEIAKIDESLNKKRADFTKVEGEIKNNPWLSSASRRGRLANAADLALNDISNDLQARQQYLDLYTQGVGEVESRLGFAVADQNLERELDVENLNFLLNEAERKSGLQVSDNVAAGLRNVPDFLAGRRDEQMRIESNERAAAAAKIAASAVEVPVLRLDESGNVLQGTAPPKASTEGERQGLIFFQRMAEAVNNLNNVEEDITGQGLLGQARMKLFDSPLLLNETQTQYEQAARQFTEARLRKDSGAAIPDTEYAADNLTYFPQPGDTPAVLTQKKNARETALNALRVASGNAYWDLYGVNPIEETVARLQGAGTPSNAATPADDAYAASLNLNK